MECLECPITLFSWFSSRQQVLLPSSARKCRELTETVLIVPPESTPNQPRNPLEPVPGSISRRSTNDEMPPTSRILYHELRDSMELKESESKKFLPEKALGNLLKKETLKQILAEERVKDEMSEHEDAFGPTDIPKLVQFITSIAPKTFATLSQRNLPARVVQFCSAGFTDKMLPVMYREDIMLSHDAQFQSVVDKVFNSKVWIWEPWHKEDFSRTQWQFLAPVFKKVQFRYQFHTDTRMPYLKRYETRDAPGAFSKMEQWSLHCDHLDEDLVMRNFEALDEHEADSNEVRTARCRRPLSRRSQGIDKV